jgi:hypothetical protein
MQIVENKTSEYPVGILWNMGSKYAREIMLKIAIMEDVIQVRVYDLKDKYADFVLDCYKGDKEAYDGGYIYEKIENMKANKNQIVAFVLKIDNPTYKTDSNGKLQCIEAREVKQRIRDEYASKIDGYFFDNLIHMSDDLEEMQRTLQVLNKYKDYGTADYVRKGYQPIMEKGYSKGKKQEKRTYIELLKGLRDEEYEK